MKVIATLLGFASPLIAVQVVKGILFAEHKLYDFMADTFPWDAAIVQSAIDLTSLYCTWIAIALAIFAVYTARPHQHTRQALQAMGTASAIVLPAAIYLLSGNAAGF
jgi:hypothetical protein